MSIGADFLNENRYIVDLNVILDYLKKLQLAGREIEPVTSKIVVKQLITSSMKQWNCKVIDYITYILLHY